MLDIFDANMDLKPNENDDDNKLNDDPLGIINDMNKAYDNVNNLITEYGDVKIWDNKRPQRNE